MLVNNQAAQRTVLMPVVQKRNKLDKKEKKMKKCKKDKNIVKPSTPEEIEVEQENVVKYSSRLHVTSAVLIAIGAIGAFGSAYHGFNARKIASKLLKPHPMNNTESVSPQADTPQFVSTDMFALVDNIRIICFILFVTSMSIACMGKMALRSTHKLKAKFSQKVFKRSIMRILFVIVMLVLAKSYTKECKHIVRRNNGGHKHHHVRKLMAVEGEYDEEMNWDQDMEQEKAHELSAKDLIDSLRGKVEDIREKVEDETKQIKEQVEKSQKTFDEEKPEWMKKGLFAFEPEEPTTYSFEKENDEQEESAPVPKKSNKKDHKRKHRKHHKPCMVITILAVALFVCHLYQLKNLAKSLISLQEMGAKPKSKKDKKEKKEKKEKKVVVEEQSEPSIQEVPAEINYSFSDHTGDCEDQQDFQFPVVQQPAPTYIINESHNMC